MSGYHAHRGYYMVQCLAKHRAHRIFILCWRTFDQPSAYPINQWRCLLPARASKKMDDSYGSLDNRVSKRLRPWIQCRVLPVRLVMMGDLLSHFYLWIAFHEQFCWTFLTRYSPTILPCWLSWVCNILCWTERFPCGGGGCSTCIVWNS